MPRVRIVVDYVLPLELRDTSDAEAVAARSPIDLKWIFEPVQIIILPRRLKAEAEMANVGSLLVMANWMIKAVPEPQSIARLSITPPH